MLVDLAGAGATARLAKLLLELAVVFLVLGVVIGLYVDVLAGVLGLGAVEEAPQVLGQVARVRGAARALGRTRSQAVVVLVGIVCHRWPFS